jgi:hypothetical protein
MMGIAFRISCRETNADRVEQQNATPRWEAEAGEKGGHYLMGKATGPEGTWVPVYNDPVILTKLDRFLAVAPMTWKRMLAAKGCMKGCPMLERESRKFQATYFPCA